MRRKTNPEGSCPPKQGNQFAKQVSYTQLLTISFFQITKEYLGHPIVSFPTQAAAPCSAWPGKGPRSPARHHRWHPRGPRQPKTRRPPGLRGKERGPARAQCCCPASTSSGGPASSSPTQCRTLTTSAPALAPGVMIRRRTAGSWSPGALIPRN